MLTSPATGWCLLPFWPSRSCIVRKVSLIFYSGQGSASPTFILECKFKLLSRGPSYCLPQYHTADEETEAQRRVMCCVVLSCSVVSDFLWFPWTAAHQASLSFTISWSLFKLMSIESVMPSNRLVLCHPLLLLPSIFPSIRVFLMSWVFATGGQSIGAAASALVLPKNIQDWFPLGLTSLILLSNRFSRVFSNTTVQKHQFFGTQPSLWSNSHIRTWLLGKL